MTARFILRAALAIAAAVLVLAGVLVVGFAGAQSVTAAVTAAGACAAQPTPTPAPTGAALARAAAARAGFGGRDLAVAVAVAGAESDYDPTAINRANRNGTADHGLWQINSVHAALLATGDWSDPYDNARMARTVWQDAGGSWSPWVTFNSGAYRQHLDPTQPAQDCPPPEPARPAGTAPTTGCPATGLPSERGLTPDALLVLRCTAAGYNIGSFAGVGSRPGTGMTGNHGTGRAVDVMIPDWDFPTGRALGDRIATWARSNADRLGVSEVIWEQTIWTVARSTEGWRPMENRGSATANHLDHVHVSVYGYATTTGEAGP
jgi:Lysozyme like domain